MTWNHWLHREYVVIVIFHISCKMLSLVHIIRSLHSYLLDWLCLVIGDRSRHLLEHPSMGVKRLLFGLLHPVREPVRRGYPLYVPYWRSKVPEFGSKFGAKRSPPSTIHQRKAITNHRQSTSTFTSHHVPTMRQTLPK